MSELLCAGYQARPDLQKGLLCPRMAQREPPGAFASVLRYAVTLPR